jgi:hypothetical protein
MIAKIDGELNARRSELDTIPQRIQKLQRELDRVERSEKEAVEHFEAMKKERRQLEASIEDREERIKKYKTQLMSVKTNREYKALLEEIALEEKKKDEEEEKLLLLMDEIDAQEKENAQFLERAGDRKAKLRGEIETLQARQVQLEREAAELEAKKPGILKELDEQLRKRYERILAKLGDFAVTRVEGEVCQGCFSRIPPQTAVEVRKNNQIITCETCGRILVHYS